MDEEYKEVLFNEHCETCKHKDLKESEIPCCYCLEDPTNLYSEKPVRWEKKD